jgi:predicted nucleic acid-binding protein
VSEVVSDSSPLNYLALLSDFDLLRQIYRTVVIPPPSIAKLSKVARTIRSEKPCKRLSEIGSA